MIRGSREASISVFDLLVGDVVLVETGDIVPTDGLLFRGGPLRWVRCRRATGQHEGLGLAWAWCRMLTSL